MAAIYAQMERTRGGEWTVLATSNSPDAFPPRPSAVIVEAHHNAGHDRLAELAEAKHQSRKKRTKTDRRRKND